MYIEYSCQHFFSSPFFQMPINSEAVLVPISLPFFIYKLVSINH